MGYNLVVVQVEKQTAQERQLTQERKSKLLQQKISVTQTTTLYSKTMNSGGKVLDLFWETQQYLDLQRKRCPVIRKSKSAISQEQKLKACTTMQFLWQKRAIPLLEKKPENIILHLGTNDAPYKSGTDI